MNKSVLMIMGGALVAAILVALVVQAKLSPSSSEEAGDTTQILVAKKAMLTGDPLIPANTEWQAWPEDSLFKGVIKKSDYPDDVEMDIYDVPVRRSIEKGEPVTRQALIADIKGGNNFLAASLAPGMRAVAISVKATTSAGGFVTPGDRVDVVLAYSPSVPRNATAISEAIFQRHASQTVLYDIRVLAVDQKASEDEREAKVGKTVTLEVTPRGAQILSLADRMGDLTLSLRRIGEKNDPAKHPPLTTDTNTSEVLLKLGKIRSSGGAGNTVRAYGGSTIQNMPVKVAPKGEDGETEN